MRKRRRTTRPAASRTAGSRLALLVGGFSRHALLVRVDRLRVGCVGCVAVPGRRDWGAIGRYVGGVVVCLGITGAAPAPPLPETPPAEPPARAPSTPAVRHCDSTRVRHSPF